MKRILSEYIPLRHVPLALGYSTLWVVALGVFGYPTDEVLAVTVIAYLAMLVSRLVIANLVARVMGRLYQYALRVVGRERFKLIEESTIVQSRRARVTLAMLVLNVVLVISGLTFVAMLPIIDYAGLTSLGFYFTFLSWILLAVSSLSLCGMFAMSFKGWVKDRSRTEGTTDASNSNRTIAGIVEAVRSSGPLTSE